MRKWGWWPHRDNGQRGITVIQRWWSYRNVGRSNKNSPMSLSVDNIHCNHQALHRPTKVKHMNDHDTGSVKQWSIILSLGEMCLLWMHTYLSPFFACIWEVQDSHQFPYIWEDRVVPVISCIDLFKIVWKLFTETRCQHDSLVTYW